MFSNNLKKLRKERGLTQKELADALGIAKSTISMYENNNREPDFETEELIADFFNVDMNTLRGKQTNLKSPTLSDDVITFPVVGDIAAGYDNLAVEDWSGDTVDVPISYLRGRDKSEFFVLNIKGDSMYPLYHEGDKVLILKQSTLNRSGDIGAVMYNGECATLKKIEYVPGEDWMRLIPLNPNYIPKIIEGADLENCRVLGIPFVLIREFH